MQRTRALRGGPPVHPRNISALCTNTYKLLECTENNLKGWVTHAQGVARLVEARGPGSFDSPLAHMMLMTFRTTSVRSTSENLSEEAN